MANARYHTPHGTRVEVAGRVAAAEGLLSVRGTDLGIPAGRLERNVPEGQYGSRLWLATLTNRVALHGEPIWAGNRPGGGVGFRIALPRRQPVGEE